MVILCGDGRSRRGRRFRAIGSWRSACFGSRRRRRLDAVHRPLEQARGGPLAGVVAARIFAGLVHETDDSSTPLGARQSRSAHAKAQAEPTEESIEKLPPPAAQAPPRSPGIAGDPLEAVALADRVVTLLDDEMEPQRLDDGRRRVPAVRMEHAREDADRPLAEEAEVTADRHRQVGVPPHDAEHLPPVHAVADDAEPRALKRRPLAARAARWPKIVHRWKSVHPQPTPDSGREVEEPLDNRDDGAYDLHRSQGQATGGGAGFLAKETTASRPRFLPHQHRDTRPAAQAPSRQADWPRTRPRSGYVSSWARKVQAGVRTLGLWAG